MSRRTARRAMVAAASAVLLLAGCGDDDSGSDPTTASAPTPSPTVTDDRAQGLQQALLAPAEVGPGFERVPFDPPDPDNPSPCGTDTVSKVYPDALRVGTEIQRGNELSLVETITVLPDETSSRAAYSLGVQGLSCPDPSAQGMPISVSPQQDVTAQVGGDQATAWQLTGEGFQAGLVAVKSGAAIITFQYTAPAGVDLSTAPDPLIVAKTGVAKLNNS